MESFSIKRCCCLINKEFIENKRTILLSAVIVILLKVLSLLFFTNFSNIQFYAPDYMIVMLLAIYYTTFIIRKDTRYTFMEELVVPATALEKYLSKILLYIIVIPLVIIAIYILALYSMCFIHNLSETTGYPLLTIPNNFILSYFIWTAIFFFGNVIHPKHSILNTILIILLLFVISSVFSLRYLWHYFFMQMDNTKNAIDVSSAINPGAFFNNYGTLIEIVIALGLYILGYFIYRRMNITSLK
ncbi:MAG: hypothetical protein JJE45_01565 [Prolixibacteraceae bacterium]|nr:hypothetical protein [Prolixibacteraceae bacterium]